MQREISITFTSNAMSILDVNLNAIAQLMKQQGFELTNLHSYVAGAQGVIGAQSQSSQMTLPLAANAQTQSDPAAASTPAGTGAQEGVKAKPPGRGKAKPASQPDNDEQRQESVAGASQAGPGELPPPRDKATPRSPEGQGFEAKLRALLTPLAQGGRGEEVNAFIIGRGYKTLSAVPDSMLGAALAAAEQHFGNVQ